LLALPGPGLRSVDLRNIGPAFGIAEGFTLAKLGGEVRRTDASIAATGVRSNEIAGFPVLELGIALDRAFEHLSTFEFNLLIDTNDDGVEDVILVGVDYSEFDDTADPGAFVTAQFTADGEEGFIDWFVESWDFNDRTLVLPFTLEEGGGLLPEKFDYVLITFAQDGSQDVQQGSIDLSKEIVLDVNSIGVDPGQRVRVRMTGPAGGTLWLFPNDIPAGQVGLSYTRANR
jgi:hypothetical protein